MISNLIKRKIFTLLKVQYSNMLEYRVEIALWAISGIIPFFMLNIWTNNNLNESINISDVMLSRYFLCAFFVRQFSVVWVVFSFEEDSLMGKVSPYLIQPLNPFFRYFAQHLAEQITRFPFALIIAFFFFIFNPERKLDLLLKKLSPVKEILIVCRSEEDAIKLENSGFTVKNKIKNEITIKIENNSITSSLKTILNNFDIEDLFINEPPIDEVIGKVLIKKNYDI